MHKIFYNVLNVQVFLIETSQKRIQKKLILSYVLSYGNGEYLDCL